MPPQLMLISNEGLMGTEMLLLSLCMFILTQQQTTLKTAMAASCCLWVPWAIYSNSAAHQPGCPRILSPGRCPHSASLSITSPSKCWWRPERLLETPPKHSAAFPALEQPPSSQWILEVGSLGVAMSILLSFPEWELHPSSLQEIFPGLL